MLALLLRLGDCSAPSLTAVNSSSGLPFASRLPTLLSSSQTSQLQASYPYSLLPSIFNIFLLQDSNPSSNQATMKFTSSFLLLALLDLTVQQHCNGPTDGQEVEPTLSSRWYTSSPSRPPHDDPPAVSAREASPTRIQKGPPFTKWTGRPRPTKTPRPANPPQARSEAQPECGIKIWNKSVKEDSNCLEAGRSWAEVDRMLKPLHSVSFQQASLASSQQYAGAAITKPVNGTPKRSTTSAKRQSIGSTGSRSSIAIVGSGVVLGSWRLSGMGSRRRLCERALAYEMFLSYLSTYDGLSYHQLPSFSFLESSS